MNACMLWLLTDMIEELIRKGQHVDAVHFSYEVGLADKFPPVPLLKAYLKDSRKAASSILGDRNNSGRAAVCFFLSNPEMLGFIFLSVLMSTMFYIFQNRSITAIIHMVVCSWKRYCCSFGEG